MGGGSEGGTFETCSKPAFNQLQTCLISTPNSFNGALNPPVLEKVWGAMQDCKPSDYLQLFRDAGDLL